MKKQEQELGALQQTPSDFFANRHYLVTGASSGIGKVVAQTLASRGATVHISGRNRERLYQSLSALYQQQDTTAEHNMYVGDLTQPQDLATVCNDLPQLDGLVYCAGVANAKPIKFIDAQYIQQIFAINFLAPTLLTAQLLKKRKINKQGSLVYISSIAAQHPYKGGAIYASSKAALEAFTKTIALEYAHKKIRANCVAPAMVQTPMYDKTQQQVSEESMKKHAANYPLGLGTASNVADTCIFLLSDKAAWITGQVLTLDGGLMVGA